MAGINPAMTETIRLPSKKASTLKSAPALERRSSDNANAVIPDAASAAIRNPATIKNHFWIPGSALCAAPE
jgi:hypothetical protein